MTALFAINDQYRSILADMEVWAEEHEGDITDFPLLEALGGIEGDLKDKALNIASLIKELKGEGTMIKEAGQELVNRGQAKLNKAKRLHEYLSDNVPMNAVYEDARAKVSWAGNGGKRPLEVMPEVAPEDFPEQVQKKVVTVDNEAVREILEAMIVEGQEPEKPGQPLVYVHPESGKELARLNPRGKSLRIK